MFQPKGIYGNHYTISQTPKYVFPILGFRCDKEGGQYKKYYTHEGTGFFIHQSGLFITARHVLRNRGNVKDDHLPSAICLFERLGKISVFPVNFFTEHDNDDISIGYIYPYDVKNKRTIKEFVKFPHLLPSFEEINNGDKIYNYGYGESKILVGKDKKFNIGRYKTQWSFGEVEGKLVANNNLYFGERYSASTNTLGGASGGPVFNSCRQVIGVNSTGGIVSTFVPISSIIDLETKHFQIENKILVKNLFD